MPPSRRPADPHLALLQGTLDLMILQSLRWGPRHGYGLIQLIRANSRDVFKLDAGSLYPALHRLEKQRLVRGTWEMSERKQRVRVYRLTKAGMAQLTAQRSRWEQFTQAVADLFAPPPAEEG